MTSFSNTYRNRRVLVTGHTGFKGSWLALWLEELGADVIGIALPPETKPSHAELLNLDIDDRTIDIRDADAIARAVKTAGPDIVFHLAAQSLVRRSYVDPIETWSANVLGTANVLEACRRSEGVRAVVAITTDKCYQNNEWTWGYRENDRLGGHDPYSASKAAAELVAESYRSAFFRAADSPLLATARAGNVIGGGDWSEDRLIPDLARATVAQESLEIRSPGATRPWQHVLESLSGYLMLGQKLLQGDTNFADAWNFGPTPEGNRSVEQVLGVLSSHWEGMRWHVTDKPQPHEASLLSLDITKARTQLNWSPVWTLDETLKHTADWYRAWREAGEVLSRTQIREYTKTAIQKQVAWAPH